MLETIKKLVAENLGIEEETITENASFKEDMGVDSLDLFELVMALEEEYDLEIPRFSATNFLIVSNMFFLLFHFHSDRKSVV